MTIQPARDPNADLSELTDVREASPLNFEANLPDQWQQGRGLFGGLVLACMSRALGACVEPSRTLRSMTAELCGPTQPGAAQVRVEMLRAGSQVSTLAARLIQGENVQAHAVAIFGNQRTTERDRVTLPAPVLKPWREVEVAPVAPPFGPDFGQFFEFRPTAALPFSQQGPACAEGFIWCKTDAQRWNAASIVCCADAFWPSTFVIESGPRPMATIAFTFELCIDPARIDPQTPLFHRAKPAAIAGGYVIEFRELWTCSGELVALNQQTLCIIK